MSYRISFRQDQCEFLIEVLAYVNSRCAERIGDGKYAPFDKFCAARTQERATEISDLIKGTVA